MTKAVPTHDIIDGIFQGIKVAFSNYRKLSGGYWLGHAPESFIQSEIARSLGKLSPLFITLEDTVDSILRDAGADLRGAKPRNSATGRIDVILWWADGTPRILIEVKKAWNYDAITKDATRLKQLLNRGGTWKNGIIAVYTDARNPKMIENRFEQLAGKSGTTIARQIGPTKRTEDNETWYWGAACFLVEKDL